MSRLKDKVCVITGAGGGMGAEAAQVFTDEGAKVVVADVDSAAASKVADSVGGLAGQGGVFARGRRPIHQRGDLSGGRLLDPRDRPRRVGARAGREHARRLPLLQVR